ncbi:MAG: hypothetical protein H0V82_04315 [Candidatus Protochlamydia sp.]|nr:hypothetical protein [Candidatus Protochlamydia sp.]
MSPDELTPIKPNFRGEALQLGKTRPEKPPQSQKSFQKLVSSDNPEIDEDEVSLIDESDLEPTTSLFDLSAKKLKAKLPSQPSQPLDQPIAKKPPLFDEGEETQIADAFYQTDNPTDDLTYPTLPKSSSHAPEPSLNPNTVSPESAPNSIASKSHPLPSKSELPQLPTDAVPAKKFQDMPEQSIYTLRRSPEKPVADPLLNEQAANTAKPTVKTPKDEALINEPIAHESQEAEAVANEGRPKPRREILALETDMDATVLESKKDKMKLTIREKNEFSQDNPDIATVNPHIHQHSNAPLLSPSRIAEEPKIPTQVDDIVRQMVEAMQVVEKGGKTDTVVTLQYPPLFKDATITLSTLEGGGKREFNLSFANLNEDAKVFLDRKIVENSLVEALARNDITIHTLKTSTLPENALNLASEAKYFAREEREQQRNQQQENSEEEET